MEHRGTRGLGTTAWVRKRERREGVGREVFRKFTIIHGPRNGIPSCFLFRGMVRNEIPRVLLQFCSTVRNSEHFSLPRNGFGTEFRDFCIPRNSRNSVGINQLFRLFRLPRNNFFVGNCQPYYTVHTLFFKLF
jgi:hypothetical protein